MGKKKKVLLDLHRFGKVRKKWETKFAKLLEANLETIKDTVEVVVDMVEETLDKTQEIIDSAKEEEVIVEEKPKATQYNIEPYFNKKKPRLNANSNN